MKEKILAVIKGAIGPDAPVELTVPEAEAFGHYATNVAMRIAKDRGKRPIELAQELAEEIANEAPVGFFEKVEAAPPGFVNFWLSKRTIQAGLADVAADKKFAEGEFGGVNGGVGAKSAVVKKTAAKKTVIAEYSSVNIAKAMNVGHFRTTIIGAALANIFESLGYKVVRWNYLGDWGTQFGKLIVAYELWGKKAAVEKKPIEELQRLYVKFHEEAATDPELEKRGQEEFQKLEAGDKENRALWEWFKKESLAEFEQLYKEIGVEFDVWTGESFFEKELKGVTEELMEKNIAERSEGAVVVKLDEVNLPPAMIEKSDGASLYLSRDIANLRYRLEKYKPAEILYVVANEQTLHFSQLFAVAKKLGWDSAKLKHIKYGMVLGESGKKLSTREGRTVAVADLLRRATELARGVVDEKARDLSAKEKDDVARVVGIGALKYNDLKENRMSDIVFDWDKMLDFTGDSGPYIQYTYARLRSILRKAPGGKVANAKSGANKKGVATKTAAPSKIGTAALKWLDSEDELALMRKIFELPDVVRKAGELYATSVLATYLHKLAGAANKFYEMTPILNDENTAREEARLVLVEVAARTLKVGLALLGIETLEKI